MITKGLNVMTDYLHEQDAFSDLAKALLSLEDEAECIAFLTDLCTIREMNDMAQRLEVALLLKAGKNYQEISKATGASTATISRVSRALSHGSGGYRSILQKLNDQ